jgi:hypothetical protein
MIFTIDSYLHKQFNDRSYNCFDFVREVWKDLTGKDLGCQTPSVHSVDTYTIQALSVAESLKKHDAPVDPCIVLMLRKRLEPHIGIYDRGRVLHLNRQGAQYADFGHVTAPYTTVQFYT